MYIQEQTFNSNSSLVGECVKIKRNTFRFFSCQHFKQFMGLQRISHYVTFKNEIILLVDYFIDGVISNSLCTSLIFGECLVLTEEKSTMS